MTQRRNGQRALHTQQRQQQRARDERSGSPEHYGDFRSRRESEDFRDRGGFGGYPSDIGYGSDDYRDGYRAGYDARYGSGSAPQEGLSGGWQPGDVRDPYGERSKWAEDSAWQSRPRSSRDLGSRGRFYGHAPQGYSRSDERIREEVCDLLMQGHVDPRQITVSVSQGEVTLEGRVERREDKYDVESLAESVLGVKDVENRIRVSSARTNAQEETSTRSESGRSRQNGDTRDESRSASRRTVS